MWLRVDAGDLIQTNVSIRVPWEIIKLAMQQSCGVILNDMDKINQHQTLTKHDKKARNVCRADAMHGRGFPQETNPNPITYHVVPGKIKAKYPRTIRELYLSQYLITHATPKWYQKIPFHKLMKAIDVSKNWRHTHQCLLGPS